ncbi:MAG: hypothetical protein RBT02_03475 [Bacteroidales bacterium]|nr:hypothetical protein [Bacteroidales bacterium]
MRKLLRYRIFGLALIMAIGITACDTASQEVEPVVSPDGYPVATFSPISKTCNEGDTVYFQITTDRPIDRSITFTFAQTGGPATADDYTAFPAVLEPYTKSVDLMIITWQDPDADESEALLGEIGVYGIADRYLLNPETINPTAVSLTINNHIGNMTVDFYWDKNITIGEYTYSTTTNVDFDFLYANAEGFDLNDVWASLPEWAAASSNYPESFSFENLADGSYYFFANLFSNALAGEGANTTIPITSVFNRQGTTLLDYELTQSEEDAMSSEQPGFDDDGSDFNMILFKVTVADGKYTIYDADDLNLGTYKKSGTGKTPRPFLNK